MRCWSSRQQIRTWKAQVRNVTQNLSYAKTTYEKTVPHSAFKDTRYESELPRESIELRVLLVWWSKLVVLLYIRNMRLPKSWYQKRVIWFSRRQPDGNTNIQQLGHTARASYCLSSKATIPFLIDFLLSLLLANVNNKTLSTRTRLISCYPIVQRIFPLYRCAWLSCHRHYWPR